MLLTCTRVPDIVAKEEGVQFLDLRKLTGGERKVAMKEKEEVRERVKIP